MFNKCSLFSAIIFGTAIILSATEPLKQNSFTGQWCVKDQGLVLVFSGKDSISVSGTADSSIQGKGSYNKTDSTFSASIKNSDVLLKMDYRYRWKDKNNIEAQAILFTVDGDSVESPTEWTVMTRCESAKKQAPADLKNSTSGKAVK